MGTSEASIMNSSRGLPPEKQTETVGCAIGLRRFSLARIPDQRVASPGDGCPVDIGRRARSGFDLEFGYSRKRARRMHWLLKLGPSRCEDKMRLVRTRL
jgi:hypothetical protein